MINPQKTHPNAALAGEVTIGGIIVTWLAGHFGVALSAEDSLAIGGSVVTLVLFVGREGLRGAWRRLLDGKPPPK